MSDAELERFYEEQVDGLYAFVFYRVGRDAALAEDVVQETFLVALDQHEKYDPDRGAVGMWLRTLSRNVIRKHTRHRPVLRELDELWRKIDVSLAGAFEAIDREPLAPEILAREETRDLVAMTMANLPDGYRNVLTKKYVAGESLAVIATGLATSEDAAKSLLARARRAFKDTFQTLSRTMVEVK